MHTALWKKNQLYFSLTDFQFYLSIIDAGKFFGLENYFKGVHSTTLNKGAKQLWLHPHDTGEILVGLQLPFPLQVNLSHVMFSKMWSQEDWNQIEFNEQPLRFLFL